jgi:putative ATPase
MVEFESFVGQKHIIGKQSALYRLISQNELPHAIFFGPAGCGKTTLANLIAKHLDLPFYALDATSLKVEELRHIINQHKNSLLKPLVFIDEIHRLSRNQEEILLLPLEKNDLHFLGASTENPYFSLSSGIRSRCMLFEFYSLSDGELEIICEQNCKHIDEDAKAFAIRISGGDARGLKNLLHFASKIEDHITLQTLQSLKNIPSSEGVSSKDVHYDLASAMIKSIRGSDVDAALYYLARLIEAKESADFIARRLVILASEDIGNANPNALTLASATLQSVKLIGFPESRIILSQCVIYLASSPKSNAAYLAINSAQAYVKSQTNKSIPKHLTKLGSKEYLYPHDSGGYVKQSYMEPLQQFYESLEIGFEKTLQQWMQKIKLDRGE